MPWFSAMGDFRIWGHLGWAQIRGKYARTSLGPLWNPLSAFLTASILSVIYSTLFGQELSAFLPYVFCGLALWTLLGNSLNDAPYSVAGEKSLLLNTEVSADVSVIASVWRNTLALLMTMPVVLFFCGLLGAIDWATLPLFPLALAIIFPYLTASSYLLGILGARFPDIALFMPSLTLLLLLVTPVFWPSQQLGDRLWLAQLNPYYWMINMLRGSILGTPPEALFWLLTAALSAVTTVMALIVSARYGRMIKLVL